MSFSKRVSPAYYLSKIGVIQCVTCICIAQSLLQIQYYGMLYTIICYSGSYYFQVTAGRIERYMATYNMERVRV